MLRRTIVASLPSLCNGNIVSTITSVLQILLLGVAIGAVLMFFRPLLVGLVRALALAIHPRPPKKFAAKNKTPCATT